MPLSPLSLHYLRYTSRGLQSPNSFLLESQAIFICNFGFHFWSHSICSATETLISSQQFVSFILVLAKFQNPMSCFLRKRVLFWCCNGTSDLVGFIRNPNFFFSFRLFSSPSNQQSFTVSYLVNELGFSQKSALNVSKRFNFDTCEKPEKVRKLFKKYGFTQTQICTIFRGNPQLLVADAEKTILPKLEFFDAKGVSWPQLAKRLCQFPTVLASSLDKQIKPSFEYFRNFLHSDEMAIATVQRYPDILIVNIGKCLTPNIDLLREHGVPNSNIAKMIPRQPQSFTLSSDKFRKIVEEVVEMGFNAKKLIFVEAVFVFRGLSKATWENKVNAYKSWGWSEEEVYKAFRARPWCMMISEDKFVAGMDLFMNKMGLRPCRIAKCPVILSLSLKKRVIPRYSVFQALLSKGLVKKEVSLSQLFNVSEKKFLQKFVAAHEDKAPELLKLYKEKLHLSNGPENDDKEC